MHGPLTHDGLGSRLLSKRRAAVDLHRRHLWAAAELGATLYVVHPDLERRKRPWSPGVAARLERSFAELRALQDELGVTIVVENMPFRGRSHFTAPGDLDLQGLGLAFDVGHAAIAGTLTGWLADPRATVRHVHLHDNHGFHGHDLHHSLGTGVVDVAPALALARAVGATIVLEHTAEAHVGMSLEHLRTRGLIVDRCGRAAKVDDASPAEESRRPALGRAERDGPGAAEQQTEDARRLRERARFLARHELFRSLTPRELERVAAAIAERVVPAGEAVLVEGGPPGTELFVVRDGTFELVAQGGRRRHPDRRRGVRPPDAADRPGAGVHRARARGLAPLLHSQGVALELLSGPRG